MIATWSALATAFLLYQIAKIVYRLFFHPLARFPGPKIAAATKWYEAYFDLRPQRPGTFFHELKRLHKVYGPIVRINPDELHVDDPTWVDKLYVNPARGIRDKYTPAALMAGAPGSGFGTSLHDIHRKRRASMSSLFSKAAAASMATVIYDKIDLMLQNMEEQIARKGFTEMHVNWLAMNLDLLTDSFFDRGMDLLKSEDRAREWAGTVDAVATSTPMAKQFTWMIPMAIRLPMWMLEKVAVEMSRLVKLRREMVSQATEAETLYSDSSVGEEKPRGKHELFQTLLSSSVLDEQEKKPERISQEAFVVLVAGSDTTARLLTNGVFFVLSNRDRIMHRLQEELVQVMPKPEARPSWQELERLPWLTAIIKETLRISAVQTSRLPVVSPREDLQYKDWVIPAGTAVGMTLREILLDPIIFEDPEAFRPERWLSGNPNLERMNRYFLPFGRGSRMCLGLNSAMVTLYIGFAAIFRRTNLDLHDTVYERDVEIRQDCFTGKASDESRGVRVKHASTSSL